MAHEKLHANKPDRTVTGTVGDAKRRSLRIGIAGAGLMGRWHADAAQKSGARVMAFADPGIDRAASLATRYSDAKAFAEVESMLEQVDLDALHICSPGPTHYPIAETAIAAGLHLLIEKPMGLTAEDTERLLERAGRREVLVCPVHQFIFQDGVLKAQELLPQIGRLVHLEATICSAGGAALPEAQLDSIVADVLPHPLSLMQCFLPGKLSPEKFLALRSGAGELRVFGEVTGVSFSFFVSMNARPTTNSFRLVGTEGTIHLDLFHGYAFMQPGQVSRKRKITNPFEFSLRNLSAATANLSQRAKRREPAYPGLRQLVSSFYQAVLTKSPSPISPADTILIAKVRDHLIQTAGLAVPQEQWLGA